MLSLLNSSKAQEIIAQNAREARVQLGFTQEGLSHRSGVPVATLRRFERTGFISLESYLKILLVLGQLEDVVGATKPKSVEFESIDDVLADNDKPKRKKGWRK